MRLKDIRIDQAAIITSGQITLRETGEKHALNKEGDLISSNGDLIVYLSKDKKSLLSMSNPASRVVCLSDEKLWRNLLSVHQVSLELLLL